MNSRNYSLLALIFFLLVCYGVASLGGYWTSLSVGGWYTGLSKPSWNPPNWVFGPVWGVLYGCMALAAWLVWSVGEWKKTQLALSLFFVQLGFNVAWSGLFFALQNPFIAFIDILALWGFVLATMIAMSRFSKWAAFLFFLYWGWISYAATLNYAIVSLNGSMPI